MPHNLLAGLTELARVTDGLGWFSARMRDLQNVPVDPRWLPVADRLAELLQEAHGLGGKERPVLVAEPARPVVAALVSASPQLRWQQTYTEADGFTREWLDNYGWVNLVSPEGLFQSEEMRVSIGYWGAGQHYDEHSHAPEETYLILAGSARFFAHGREPRDAFAGETVHHAPHQKHAFSMTDGPLLAAAFWRGNDLLKKSDLRRDADPRLSLP